MKKLMEASEISNLIDSVESKKSEIDKLIEYIWIIGEKNIKVDTVYKRIKKLCTSVPDINETVDGLSPLHHASIFGDVNTVGILLTAGANPLLLSKGDSMNFTPIENAELHGHDEIMKLMEAVIPSRTIV